MLNTCYNLAGAVKPVMPSANNIIKSFGLPLGKPFMYKRNIEDLKTKTFSSFVPIPVYSRHKDLGQDITVNFSL